MKTLHRSFAGGEIAPEMFGRLDLTKFQTGLQKALNFITLPHGPAARRPGFSYVNRTRDSNAVRLIPFIFSDAQSYVIEFGNLYVRFHNKNGTLLETAKTITASTNANPGVFTVAAHGWSDGDQIYVSLPGMVALDSRFLKVINSTTNTFQLTELYNSTPIDTTTLGSFFLGGTAARVYTLASPYSTSTAKPFYVNGLTGIRYTQNADVLTLSHPDLPTYELRRISATVWTFTQVSFALTLAAPTGLTATPTASVNPITQDYVVTAVASDLITESPPSTAATCTNNLSVYGNYNTLTWTASAGAARYYVYKKRGGAYGYIGQTTGLTIVDDNILPDSLTSPPANNITLNTGTGEYPTAVTYYEQRRWFAGTTNSPQGMWATRSSTESNLSSSIPSRADDGLSFRLASQTQQTIKHLVPLADLIALTSGGEFRIFADGATAITPTSLSIKPQSYSGASEAQPALTNSSVLYVQAQGSRIREIAYDPSGTGFYRSVDASLFAPHLFDGYTVSEICFSRAPNQIMWGVRNDGTLLGMTYVPDQAVVAWHQHTTSGTFKSCCTIPENGEDVLYVVVNRGGNTGNAIERIKPRVFTGQANAFFVDSGLTYTGGAITTVRGLNHLEGRAVQVLADGAVVSGLTVAAGAITLPLAASTVTAGLAYNSDLQTLPATFEKEQAGGYGTMKNVSKVYLRVVGSSLVKAGPSFDKLTTYPPRQVSDLYGSPPALRTGELDFAIGPSWNTDGTICVRQDEPLPLTVSAIAVETAIGG